MKVKQYVLLGCLVGVLAPAALLAVSVATHHVFESWAAAALIPGFLPFGSSDPEEQMSWLQVVAGLALNAAFFGVIGLFVGSLLKGRAQPDAPADGLRPPLS